VAQGRPQVLAISGSKTNLWTRRKKGRKRKTKQKGSNEILKEKG
jgi:hypothetical protein